MKLHKVFWPLWALAMVFLVGLAASRTFILDDAYISFRYAEHLAQGQGLVWNVAERVEGYTSFLWTVLMAIPLSAGQEPRDFAVLLGLGFFASSCVLTFRIATKVLQDRKYAALAMFLVGTNYTFSSYATGGLETAMQASGFLLLFYLALTHRALWFSLAAFWVLATRLDGGVCVMVCATWLLLRGARVWRVLVPVAVLTAIYLLGKQQYYGQVLPNTYYAKVGEAAWQTGGHYVGAFLFSYLFVFYILPAASLLRAWRKMRWTHPVTWMFVLCLAWFAYVARIGGDFMEFRFLAAIVPFVVLLCVWLTLQVASSAWMRLTLLSVLAAGTWLHPRWFNQAFFYDGLRLESIAELEAHVDGPNQNWRLVGQRLNELLPADCVIATTASGAIPYYAKRRCVDMLGLTDADIARRGLPVSAYPGHRRIARVQTLLDKNVQLVIGHPWTLSRAQPRTASMRLSQLRRLGILVRERRQLPGDAVVVRIPIDAQIDLRAVLLQPGPAFDAWPQSEIVP